MSRQIRVNILNRIPEEESFAQQWNRLVQSTESPQVFYTHEWALAVSRAYTSPSPLLITAYREDSLVGVAALALDEERREVSFLCGTTADYCDFVSAPSDREELIVLMMRELRDQGIETLQLANLPADSISVRVLQRFARSAGFAFFARPAYFCARIEVKSPEQRLQIARSAHRNSKKTRNALSRIGEIAIDHNLTYREFAAEFPEFATANISRFLAAGRISNLLSREKRDFVSELARLLARREWLSMSTLKLDGRTIAWQLGFKFANTWSWYLPAFDTELRDLHPGPGSYLAYQILQSAAQDPAISVVDLGLGDEGYKQQYACTGRQTSHIVATCSKFRLVREFSRYQSAKFIKQLPALERVTRRSLTTVSSVMARFDRGGVLSSLAFYSRDLWNRIFPSKEFFFLEAIHPGRHSESGFTIVPVTMKLLARIAMDSANDPDTLDYVLRCAERLRCNKTEAFAVVDAQGSPVHVSWVAPFDGFQVPGLQRGLMSPSPHAVVLFDDWTYTSQRVRRALFTSMVSAHTLAAGKQPWVCADDLQISDLEAAGFVLRFSLINKRRMLLVGNSTLEFRNAGPKVALHSAA